jgi:hypothetical protein
MSIYHLAIHEALLDMLWMQDVTWLCVAGTVMGRWCCYKESLLLCVDRSQPTLTRDPTRPKPDLIMGKLLFGNPPQPSKLGWVLLRNPPLPSGSMGWVIVTWTGITVATACYCCYFRHWSPSLGTSVPFGGSVSALETPFSSWRARTGDSE